MFWLFFSYQYEIGAAKYYNIPDYLVQIDLLQVIFHAVLLYIIVFMTGLIIYLLAFNFFSLFLRLYQKLSMLSPNHGFKIDQPFKDYAIVKIYGDSIIALAIDGKRRVLKNDILLLTKDQSINGTVKYFHNIKVE